MAASSSSFQKRTKTKLIEISGTRASLYNNQLLVSSGIPSLDAVLGGGVAVGTVLLIEEDATSMYAQLMLKYFAAEAIVTGQALTFVSTDQDPHKIIKDLPLPVSADPTEKGDAWSNQHSAEGGTDETMSIAWRYQNQPKPAQRPTSTQFGHYYDLTKTMEESKVNSSDIQCISFADLLASEKIGSHSFTKHTNPRYTCLLQKIQKRIEEGHFGTGFVSENRKILRIAIHSLGSPFWGENGGIHAHSEERDASLLQLLLALRATLRTAFAIAFITIPKHLFQDGAFVWRLEQLCDTVLRLQSFGASEKEKCHVFKDHSGLLHVIKLPCLNELVTHMPETLDLAFRLRRKKFTIEKLHLPPELSDTSGREQDDPVPLQHPVVSCGSAGQTALSAKLDF